MDGQKPIIVFDQRLLTASEKIPNTGHRQLLLHSLLKAYNLYERFNIFNVDLATDEDLVSFHSTDYIQFIKNVENSTDVDKIAESEDAKKFNLGYDCPLFPGIYEFVKLIVGSTLTAAKKLVLQVHGPIDEIIHLEETEELVKPKSYLRYKLNEDQNTESEYDFCSEKSLENEFQIDNKTIRLKQERKCIPPVKINTSEKCTVAVNWFGGWHHAQRDEAEGFCYVNDIVIAIQYLLKYFSKILYIDLDVHHGNGVENAFAYTKHVLTLSIHQHEPGFYPGTGSITDAGSKYNVNIPLRSGMTNGYYTTIFQTVFKKTISIFKPNCIVIQCGADGMSNDPIGEFNLTQASFATCLKVVLLEKLPTLVLGGGGYNAPNVARCWTYLTSIVAGCTIPEDIPENDLFNMFGPDFTLNISPNLRKDNNSREYLQYVMKTVMDKLENMNL